jgi:hypothetical protein
LLEESAAEREVDMILYVTIEEKCWKKGAEGCFLNPSAPYCVSYRKRRADGSLRQAYVPTVERPIKRRLSLFTFLSPELYSKHAHGRVRGNDHLGRFFRLSVE